MCCVCVLVLCVLYTVHPSPRLEPARVGHGTTSLIFKTHPNHERNGWLTRSRFPVALAPSQRGGDEWFNNTIDQFSAACWYFAETLTDMAEAAGEPEMPLGLIECVGMFASIHSDCFVAK